MPVGLDLPSGHRYAWHDDAMCAQIGPAIFFVEKGSGAAAKRVCAGCPVREQCLDDAMAEEDGRSVERRFGVRGGLGPKERYRLAKRAEKLSKAVAR